MRGIELPINVLVIIMLAVIVLIAVLALYFGGFVQPASSMSLESARQQACTQLIQKGLCGDKAGPLMIPIKNFDANKDGKLEYAEFVTGSGIYLGDNLSQLCINYFNCQRVQLSGGMFSLQVYVADQDCCAKKVCNCLV